MELLKGQTKTEATASWQGRLWSLLAMMCSLACGCAGGGPPLYETTAVLQYGIPGRGAIALAWENEPGRTLAARLDLAADTLTVTTLDGKIGQYAVADGKHFWSRSFKGGFPAGAISIGEKLIVAKDGDFSRLFCLSRRSGNEIWSFPFGEVLAAPVIRDDAMFVASRSGRVRACSLTTGGKIWEQTFPGPVRAGLLLSDSLLYLATAVDTLFALSAATGETRWSAAPGGAVYGAPVRCANLIWTISYDGLLAGWNRISGNRERWHQLPERYRTGVTVAGNRLLLLTVGGILSALDSENLTELWRVDLDSVADQPPTIDGDLVWVGLRNGRIQGLRIADGKSLIRLQVPAPVTAPIVSSGRFVLISAGGGQLIAFRRDPLETGQSEPVDAVAPERSLSGFKNRADAGDLALQQGAAKMAIQAGIPTAMTTASDSHHAWLAAYTDNAASASLEAGPLAGELNFKQQLLWLTGWVGGSALALWFESEADGSYDDYRHLGGTNAREDAFDKTQRYDRYALAAWVGAEACFLVALKNWLTGGDQE